MCLMEKGRGKYLSSRYETETSSRLGENTIDDYGIAFTRLRVFLLDLSFVPGFYSQISLLCILINCNCFN